MLIIITPTHLISHKMSSSTTPLATVHWHLTLVLAVHSLLLKSIQIEIKMWVKSLRSSYKKFLQTWLTWLDSLPWEQWRCVPPSCSVCSELWSLVDCNTHLFTVGTDVVQPLLLWFSFGAMTMCVSMQKQMWIVVTSHAGHIFTARLHVVCLFVRLSVCNVGGSGAHRLEILETNCTIN